MQKINFELWNRGDAEAGVQPVSEDITLTLKYGGWDDETPQILAEEMLNSFRKVLDGRTMARWSIESEGKLSV